MTPQRIDWSQLWYPGRKQPFTADEMARAGADGMSPTLQAVAAVNFASVAFTALALSPPGQTARMSAALLALGVWAFWAARYLWQRPWRRPLLWVSLALVAAMLGLSVGARLRMPNREERLAFSVTLLVGTGVLVVCLLLLTLWRAQQIEARLREQAERAKAIEMAQRLAAAQLEPHFLFNTLASVQHWVHTRDERAAPLLDALVGYLRATLPMFSRPLQPLGDELEAVRRYLQVMGTRLGQRLHFSLDVPTDLQVQTLPPGLLLTLVENAVVHGVEPLLAGGQVQVQARRVGAQLELRVVDNGPGPGPAPQDGQGLANCRARLALACGPQAQLRVQPGADGGCVASVLLPWNSTL
jgi:signal transduction histidine kinase